MKRTRRHALGQHFLADRGTLGKILALIRPEEGDLIIEIGGGRGALTLPLTERAGQVFAIERDPELASHLAGLGAANLRVFPGDALKMDFTSLARPPLTKVVGNLPYAISSPLLFKIIAQRKHITSCVFLVQKEFALRVCAEPGTKAYAPMSIMTHIHFKRKIHFTVKPGAFSPPPKVDSAVISLVKRGEPLLSLDQEDTFLTFLQGCFSQRRKKLSNNLKAMGFPVTKVEEALSGASISPDTRAEQLAALRFHDLLVRLAPDNSKEKIST
jgi:16S rRNA (adenine1518-N6/adenine1519-N6)-dimethyltransferase